AVNLSCYLPGFDITKFCSQVTTVMVKTRSSGSSGFGEAQLKDFVIAPFTFIQPPPCALNGPSVVCQGGAAQFCETASASLSHTWSFTSVPPGIVSEVGSPEDSSCATFNFLAAGTATIKVLTVSADHCSTTCEQ